ncbi:Iron-sulfur assembly 2 [Hyphodiscus hymeniophilus]|uniref:Iron-sulfur assembly 2 n=1 Tax=Hyphodiscus hymeniophilus TaxID=353542 RepID=A0A9P7AWE8_9HELO|nr:Iron-sulfur assembly 2 [Hyphodiscus hymeniophilus]
MATRCIVKSCSHLTPLNPSLAARAFLHLAPGRYFQTTPPLDFLLPSISTPVRRGLPSKQSLSKTQQSRAFKSSSIRRATSAVVNPKKDDDGNDMSVEITPRASNRLKEIMSQDSNPNLALRIQVESGGCHGFQYLMSLTTLPPLDSSSAAEQTSKEIRGNLDEDDTVFAVDDGSGAKIVMDGPSLDLLKGSKVDFSMELIGSQFKIVDNPLATSSCGCGTSFDIKA